MLRSQETIIRNTLESWEVNSKYDILRVRVANQNARKAPINWFDIERFSIECRKTKTKTNYLPIRLHSLSQTVVKPKPKQLSNYFRHPIENRSMLLHIILTHHPASTESKNSSVTSIVSQLTQTCKKKI